MTTKEAISQIGITIADIKPERLEDLAIVLALGAGHISLLSEGPASPEKFLDWASVLIRYELQDAVALDLSQGGTFAPVYGGDWESVLASLVVDNNWDLIRETAEDLLKEGKLKEQKPVYPESGFWQLERVAARL